LFFAKESKISFLLATIILFHFEWYMSQYFLNPFLLGKYGIIKILFILSGVWDTWHILATFLSLAFAAKKSYIVIILLILWSTRENFETKRKVRCRKTEVKKKRQETKQ
jgi:hypothetical protein